MSGMPRPSAWDELQVRLLRAISAFVERRLRALTKSPQDSPVQPTRDIEVLALEMWRVFRTTPSNVTVQWLNDEVCRHLNSTWSVGSRNYRRLYVARLALRYGAHAIDSTSTWPDGKEGLADTYRRSVNSESLTEESVLASVKAYLAPTKSAVTQADDARDTNLNDIKTSKNIDGWQYDYRAWCWETLSVLRTLESIKGPVSSKVLRETLADRFGLTQSAREVISRRNSNEKEYSARCATMRDLLVRMKLIERLPGIYWHVLPAGLVAKNDDDFDRLTHTHAHDLGGSPNATYRGNPDLEQEQKANEPTERSHLDVDRELRRVVFHTVARLSPADTRTIESAVEQEIAQSVLVYMSAYNSQEALPALLEWKQLLTRGALVKTGLIVCGEGVQGSHADHAWRLTETGKNLLETENLEDALEETYQTWRQQVSIEEIPSLTSEYASAGRPPTSREMVVATNDDENLAATTGVDRMVDDELGVSADVVAKPILDPLDDNPSAITKRDVLSLPADGEIALSLLNSLEQDREIDERKMFGKAQEWLRQYTAWRDEGHFRWTRPGESENITEYTYRVAKITQALADLRVIEKVGKKRVAQYHLTARGHRYIDSDEGISEDELQMRLKELNYEPRMWQDAVLTALLDGEHGVTPKGFERFIEDLLKHRYLLVERNSQRFDSGGDGGWDGSFILPNSSTMGLFECKRWERKKTVGVDRLGRFVTALENHAKASFGLLVTTSEFSQAVKDDVKRLNKHHELIRLVTGEDLCEMMREHNFGIRTDDGCVVSVDKVLFKEYRSD